MSEILNDMWNKHEEDFEDTYQRPTSDWEPIMYEDGNKLYAYLVEQTNPETPHLLGNERITNEGIVLALDHGKGKKFCYKSSLTDFSVDYLTKGQLRPRNYYEIIVGPQKPHFDIDAEIKPFSSFDEMKAMTDQTVDLLIESIGNVMRVNNPSYVRERDLQVFNSNGETKQSYHIVIDGFMHADNKEAKTFYDLVVIDLAGKYDSRVSIDPSVYSSRQQFRLLHSQKQGSGRIKVFDQRSRPENGRMAPLDVFISTLVSKTNGCRYLMGCEAKAPLHHFNPHTNDVQAEHMYQIFCLYNNGHLAKHYKRSNSSSTGLDLIKPNNLSCPIHNRVHERVGAFLTLNKGFVYFRCQRTPGVQGPYLGMLSLSQQQAITDDDDHGEGFFSFLENNGSMPSNDKKIIVPTPVMPEVEELRDVSTLVPITLPTKYVPPKSIVNITYDVYDPFTYDDFLEEMSGASFFHNGYTGDVIKRCNGYYRARELLLRCARIIDCGVQGLCLKRKNDIFHFHKSLRTVLLSNIGRFTQELSILDEQGEEKKETKALSIFLPLKEEPHLFSSGRTEIRIVHRDDPNRYSPNTFNMFPGFQARKISPLTEEHMSKIAPLLSHIRNIWANGNEEHYNYIMSWLAYPLRTCKKTEVALFLYSRQGAGKGVVLNFLREYVYGDPLTSEVSTLDLVASRFNSALSGKLLVVINETTEDRGKKKEWGNAQQERFKSLITDPTFMLERKGIDPIKLECNTSFIGCTNHENSILIKDDDRRFALFSCSNAVIGNREYFDTLVKAISTQEVGNIFYTYLRQDIPELMVPIRNIPKTEIRESSKQVSKTPTVRFLDELLEGFVPLSSPMIKFIRGSQTPLITTNNLYEVYKQWLRENHPSSTPVSNTIFGKNIADRPDVFSPHRARIDGVQQRGNYIMSLYDQITVIINSEFKEGESMTLQEYMTTKGL